MTRVLVFLVACLSACCANCGEVWDPVEMVEDAADYGPAVPPQCVPEENTVENAQWLCDKTLRLWCVQMEECGQVDFRTCYDRAFEVVCEHASATRDSCALQYKCWPWIRELGCDIIEDPEFRLSEACRSQFEQGYQ